MKRRKRPRSDDGETLVEVLVALVILGLAAVVIVGAIGLGAKVSDIHRKESTAGAKVRDYAEAIQNYVSSAASNYRACAGANAYAPATVGFTLPTGYTAQQTAATTWNGTSWVACSADTGIQRVTLSLASSDLRATETLTLVIRQPCSPAVPCS